MLKLQQVNTISNLQLFIYSLIVVHSQYVNIANTYLLILYLMIFRSVTHLSAELAQKRLSLSVVWLYSFAVQPKGNVAYILAHLTVKECSVEGFARSRKLWKPIQFCLKVSRKGKKQIVFNITS